MHSVVTAVTSAWPLAMHLQPVVDLETGTVVGYEALARDVRSGSPAPPGELFARARAEGRLSELDWACRTEALRAVQAVPALEPGSALFVNAEPASAGSRAPQEYEDVHEQAARSGLTRVLEITERALTGRLGPVLAMAEQAREAGWRIALDDVGADWSTLALLPLLRPEVIKLDLRLLRGAASVETIEVVSAVAVQAAETGALVLAEGIETTEQAELARSMGATLGQGYLLGHPAPFQEHGKAAGFNWPSPAGAGPVGTPWQQLPDGSPVRRSTKPLLVGISRWLERKAFALGEPAVVLATFERSTHFTGRTARRYADLAASASVVGTFARGLPAVPAAGVRGVDLAPDDPLCAEWDVVVLGPHFCGALLARDVGDDGPDDERRFDYLVTYDRDRVRSAATHLLARLPDLPLPADSPTAAATVDVTRGVASTVMEPAASERAPNVRTGLATADERTGTVLPAGSAGGWVLAGASTGLRPLLGTALATSSNGLAVCDARLPDLPLIYVNDAYVQMSGYSPEQLLGRNARLLQGAATDPAAIQLLHDAVRAGREARVTLRNVRPDGGLWWNAMNLVPVRDGEDRVTHWVGTQYDVTERVRAEEQAAWLAAHDPMTGLANRRHLAEHLPAEIGRAGRAGTGVALLYFDLDGFKAVNDEHGHVTGDLLLVAVAQRLRAHVRVGDLLVRQGGDEFLLVLASLPPARPDTARAALAAAEHLLEQLRMPFCLDGHDAVLTTAVSIGISLWPHDAADAATMIGHADTALYSVKNDGRDATALYEAPAAASRAESSPSPG